MRKRWSGCEGHGSLGSGNQILSDQVELNQSMVDQTVEKLGKLDIAVNNAGVISIKSAAELTGRDWDFVRMSTPKVFLAEG